MQPISLVLSSLLALAASTLAFSPNLSGRLERRIIGGYEVSPPFKYNFMVSLQKVDSFQTPICAGVLLNYQTVLTAAQCTTGNDADVEVDIHRHDLSKKDYQEAGKRFKVIKRIKHPWYDSATKTYDLAIWKLSGLNTTATGIVLDDGTYGNDGNVNTFTTIGWGITAYQGLPSAKLLEVQVPSMTIANCQAMYKGDVYVRPEALLCTGYNSVIQGTCQGDQGGPLFVVNDGVTTLVGISSWTPRCSNLSYKPSVYTRISHVVPWINANIV